MAKHPQSDQLIASAARYLIDGGERDVASLLLACTIEDWYVADNWNGEHLALSMRGPRTIREALSDIGHPLYQTIKGALEAVLPHYTWIESIDIRADLVVTDPEWASELQGIARGRTVTNNDGTHSWNNMRFASASEVKIAQALDEAGVMFFPSSKTRLNGPDGRENRVPDFLVCKDGKWGILEVDGEPFHPPSRTVHDHARDELFHLHGIRVVRHYDANECYNTPKAVVANFISLLEKHYR